MFTSEYKSTRQIIKYITLGELLFTYSGWIIWFVILLTSWFVNRYLIGMITNFYSNNLIDKPDELGEKIIKILTDKLAINKIVIQYSLITYTGLFLTRKYLSKIFGKVVIEQIFGIGYFYTTLLSSTLFESHDYFKEGIHLPNQYEIFKVILFEYTILEIILVIPILAIFLFGIIYGFAHLMGIVWKKVSPIQIQYTEENIVQIDKQV